MKTFKIKVKTMSGFESFAYGIEFKIKSRIIKIRMFWPFNWSGSKLFGFTYGITFTQFSLLIFAIAWENYE